MWVSHVWDPPASNPGGCSPNTACEAPGTGMLFSPTPSCHHRFVGKPRPRGPRGVCGHRSLETLGTSGAENPRCLLDYPTKGCDPAGHHPGLNGQSCLSYPQRQDWKEWGFAWSSAFLILLSLVLSIHPFLSSIHHPYVSLPFPGSGLGEGEPNGGSSIKSCPHLLGNEEAPFWGKDNSKGVNKQTKNPKIDEPQPITPLCQLSLPVQKARGTS